MQAKNMMMAQPPTETDTIVALATAAGRAAIQVIRVSGSQTESVLAAHAGLVPRPRRMTYGRVRTVAGEAKGQTIDKGMLVFFPKPASPTGEDYAEFHLHGAPQISKALLESLISLPRVRLAEAGEFTRRAFFNGKLSLDQAEAIADMIDADTSAQHRQAMARLDKPLGHITETWRGEVIGILAEIEASLDFADEDIPPQLMKTARARLASLTTAISDALAHAKRGAVVRDGMHIVLLGRPNVGKSTLLNALLGREDAIVSAEAGTTRDIIQATLDMDGYAVCLKDTAGMRDAAGGVESEGIRRAQAAAQTADMVVCLIDSNDADPEASLAELLAAAGIGREVVSPKLLPIRSKADLMPKKSKANDWLAISAKNRTGLAQLRTAIKGELDSLTKGSEAALVVRTRHRLALEDCVAALQAAARVDYATHPELLAEELRAASQALGRIAGRVDVEDILDEIFASFCIGK